MLLGLSFFKIFCLNATINTNESTVSVLGNLTVNGGADNNDGF